MAADAIAVLDELRIDRAHVIGLSLGGFIAQEIAIAYPERVQSLTLMSTSADPTDASMPGPRTWPLIESAIAGLPLLRYRVLGGETNLVKELLAGLVAQGGDEPVDVEEWTRIVLYDLRERGGLNLRALRQHQVAVAVTRSRYPLLGTITAPTLVIHGTRDTFLPIEHGHRLAAAIPSACGLWLEDAEARVPLPEHARGDERRSRATSLPSILAPPARRTKAATETALHPSGSRSLSGSASADDQVSLVGGRAPVCSCADCPNSAVSPGSRLAVSWIGRVRGGYCRAMAIRRRSSGSIRWSWSSSPVSICTQLIFPVNRLVRAEYSGLTEVPDS